MTTNKSILNPEVLKKQIEVIAEEQGIYKWDIGASSSTDISVQVDKGESKQLKGSQRYSMTIRVWNEQCLVGITSTNDVSEYGIRKAFKGASIASQYGNDIEPPDFSKLAMSPLAQVKNIIHQNSGINKLLDLLKKAEFELINSCQYINSVPYNGLSESLIERLYLNSLGANRYMKVSQASIYLYAKAEKEGRKPRSAGSVKVANGIDDLHIQECIDESISKTISHIDYKPIITDKYLVCFSPEAFLDLIGAFSNIFNARSIIDGQSLSTISSLGTDISVPFISISDEPLHEDNIGSFSFDGEGTPKRNIILVRDGKLINFIHSEATARKFNVSPTGHASMGAKASVSPEWFVISKTNKSKCLRNDLSHTQSKCKYVLIDNLNALHAGVKSSQGSFSLPFDGWIVENGTRTSIEAATVAGDIKALLLQILQIEEEQHTTHNGVSPHIWVDKLSITGEA
ncbi:TldD/PmbA family protein [Prochlorococcus sp. MIT 1223]|uniref:TldD/PmbA family protein n=1 Tax=Prochlorococcus sp. MIT 1223 TaxID=3096217 RepID=UPI002A75A826|nr:TldD/PmbA family protein [Prochlorococcus sp. MIT 1223]